MRIRICSGSLSPLALHPFLCLLSNFLFSHNRSDGPQPHTINIHFAKRVFVKKISMYLDFENDESYTPTRMSVFSGTGYHDLQEVTTMNFEQPSGWIDVNLEGVHEEYVSDLTSSCGAY